MYNVRLKFLDGFPNTSDGPIPTGRHVSDFSKASSFPTIYEVTFALCLQQVVGQLRSSQGVLVQGSGNSPTKTFYDVKNGWAFQLSSSQIRGVRAALILDCK